MRYDCGVAIGVPRYVQDEAIRMTKEFERICPPLSFGLNNESMAHITLYQGRFRSKELAHAAWKRMGSILFLGQIRVLAELELRPNGNVFWKVQPSRTLSMVHMKVARMMQRQTGEILRDQELHTYHCADAATQRRIKEYGMAASGEFYHPHITLCRIMDTVGAHVLDRISPPEFEFAPQRMWIGPINEFGQMFAPELESTVL